MPIIFQLIINDKDRFGSKEELKYRLNKSISEVATRWTLEECLHKNPHVKSIILQIKVKENQTGLTEKYKKELISYLNNSMRHIADDWEIDECLHENPHVVDEDTLT